MEYRTEDGNRTTANDPERLLWYGVCTYWTDDWERVRTVGVSGIPCCPKCLSPGFQITASKWFAGAKRYESEGHPRYVEFLKQSKGQCHGRTKFMSWYRDWMEGIDHADES